MSPGKLFSQHPLTVKLRRWAAGGFIAVYLGALGLGNVSHALHFKDTSHWGMYFFVWDMFCGWSSYSLRLHAVAEGESGRYYDLSNGPWGSVTPYGSLERLHYDTNAVHTGRHAFNVLRHTSHEPITRILLVEECWAKKFNLPAADWEERFEVPKDPRSYYATRLVLDGRGRPLARGTAWAASQLRHTLLENPRVVRGLRGPTRVARAGFGGPVTPAGHEVPATW